MGLTMTNYLLWELAGASINFSILNSGDHSYYDDITSEYGDGDIYGHGNGDNYGHNSVYSLGDGWLSGYRR